MILDKIIIRSPYLAYNHSGVDLNYNVESLYISSPSFTKEFLKNKLSQKEKITLYKYKSRITTRSTPFGLFAGVGIINIGEKNNINLPNNKEYQKNLRLDMNYIGALIRHLESTSEIQKEVLWFPNNTLHKNNDKIRFIESYFLKARKFNKLSAVDYSLYLDKILAKASSGFLIKDLAKVIVDEDISIEDSTEFIYDLIANQLLISELELTVTTNSNLKSLITILKKLSSKESQKTLVSLLAIEKQINNINKSTIGNTFSAYEDLAKEIETIGVGFDLSKLFQMDMYIPKIKGTLDRSIITDIEKSVEGLKHLSIDNVELKSLKDKFRTMYEDEEISLFEVFDDENGIYYSNSSPLNPLINNINIYGNNSSSFEMKNTAQEVFKTKLFKENIKNENKSVKIDNKSLKTLNKTKKALPPSYSTMFRIFKEDGIEKIYLESVWGTSAINLLGRFAHLNQDLEKHIKTIAKKEEEILSDAIMVDIVHLPEDRTGNILLRPVLHKHQIPYLAKANVAEEFQIPVSDLKLSLQGNRFILRSKKLNKEIIPRLSNAHNFSNPMSLPIYKFLCDIQNQSTLTWLGFSWGHLRNYYVFAPRVEYNNVILNLAEWRFNREHLKSVLDAFKQKNKQKIEEELNNWQKKYNVPNKFVLAEGDNELYINMQDELAKKVFVNEIKNKQSFTLKEFLMTEDNDTVSGPDGNYAHQFVASFVNEEYKIPKFEPRKEKLKIQRKFSLGSEWLYYKIYAGAKTLDHLLSEEIKELIEGFKQENLIDSWFFIRYSDPDQHLRIRFHFTDKKNISKVILKINEVFEPLIEQRVIHKLDNEIYNREIERYGSNTMVLSEELFHADSQIITEFINFIEGDSGEEVRWLFALKMIDCFLSDFGFGIDRKIDFVGRLKKGFTQEFNFSKPQNKTLNNKYREERTKIMKMLHPTIEEDDEWSPLFELLKDKSEITKETIQKILKVNDKQALEMELFNLLSSYTHMTLNRLFLSQQRLNETAVYFLLEKHYKSIKAYNPNK